MGDGGYNGYYQQIANYYLIDNPELIFLCDVNNDTPRYEVAGTYFETFLQHRYYMTKSHTNTTSSIRRL